ncbi:MAG: ArsA family ATPase [Desulfobacterales bacterium]|nr:ArsA family ATPase [Desulfobacterales bacterium]
MQNINEDEKNAALENKIDKSWLDKRVIFVLGKGGVGKTTISMAMGVAASHHKKKILLVEVGMADNIGHIFCGRTLAENIEMIHKENQSEIWGVRINPRAVIEDYIHVNVGINFISNRITRSKLFDHLSEATPGLKEVMTLGQIWRWEQMKDEKGNPFFDMIIVDAPATGHGVSLLRIPQALIEMIKVGPIVEQTKVVQNLFRDQSQTWVVAVTLPEELPVNETIELQAIAENELKMPVKAIFINGIYPKIFTEEDIKEIQNLHQNSSNMSKQEKILLESAMRKITRRNLQHDYADLIKKKSKCDVIEIPFFYTNELSLKQIEEITYKSIM